MRWLEILAVAAFGTRVASAQPAADDLDIPATTPETAPPSAAPAKVVAPPAPPSAAPAKVVAPTAPSAPAPSAPASSPVVAPPQATSPGSPVAEALGLEIRGYVQVQAQIDQQSEDQLAQGGAQLNQDLLTVRRGRVSIARAYRNTAVALELDVNTVRGATVGARRAEATLVWPEPSSDVPRVALTAGLTDIPFGYELLESSRKRLFNERSVASLAWFPGEPDIGARLWGGHGPFRYAVALFAGEPISDRAGHNRPDPNAAKDLIARVGIDRPWPCVAVSGGVSLLAGTGFHEGKSATKDTTEWRDLNENGAVDFGEVIAVPGTAATPSANFRRWALGADLQVGLRLRPGWTRISAEVTVASNLDRGLFVADPITSGTDARELGAYLAVVQDIGAHVFGGVRLDYYDPNLDALDARGGMLIPFDETITTIAPVVGIRLPHGARLAIQYDWIVDHLARDGSGVPTDLANDRLTARLQVEL